MSKSSSTEPQEKREFQAEVSQLLDIVINSLYKDKEIFIRELVSNASDSLEKLRHTQLTEKEIFESDLPSEINITTDEEANTITILDHGIGMTRDELHENLGTIAHSDSKQFMKALAESKKAEDSSVIGQFGVGFYSAFMVADEVKVYTHSWRNDGEHLVWSSDGKTNYEVEEAPDQQRGCKIVLKLREDANEYAKDDRVKSILESYSSFISFPILLNGERVNTVEALWRKRKSEVSDEEYNEFYKFTAKAFDDPVYRMHFSTDAPIEINSLLFTPTQNTELFGMGQMEPGVSLYCKNVLIDDKPEGLLPEWLRFLRGVIDSADIPLNISRESMQDSGLIKKINRVVTKRFIKFLDSEAKDDADKYKEFYTNFGRFLKEGVVTDSELREGLTKLLRFESSMTEKGELTSFEDYLTRAKDGQEKIYYLTANDRPSIEAGPYLEAFQSRGIEVIYFYDSVDEILVQHLHEFDGKSLVSASSATVELDDDDLSAPKEGEPLSDDDLSSLCEYLTGQLGDRVEKVSSGTRLVDSPVAALTPEHGMNSQMRAMMQAMNPDEAAPPLKVELEINPRHELIHLLNASREKQPELAELVSAQLFDQALLNADLLEDRKGLVARGFDLMKEALKKKGGS